MAIPAQELEQIRQRFEQLSGSVKIDYFHQSTSTIVIPGREPCATCDEVREALREIAALSDKIQLSVRELADEPAEAKKRGIDRVPGIVIRGELNRPLRFYGLPAGTFLPLLLGAIIGASGKAPQPPAAVSRSLKKLRAPLHLRVFGSLTHDPSGMAATAAFGLALSSSKVDATVYQIDEFPALAQQLRITRIPMTFIDQRGGFAGVTGIEQLARFLYDVQAHPAGADLAPPEIAPDSSHPWQPPAPPPGTRQTSLAQAGGGVAPATGPAIPPPSAGERRTPGGIIIPGR